MVCVMERVCACVAVSVYVPVCVSMHDCLSVCLCTFPPSRINAAMPALFLVLLVQIPAHTTYRLFWARHFFHTHTTQVR